VSGFGFELSTRLLERAEEALCHLKMLRADVALEMHYGLAAAIREKGPIVVTLVDVSTGLEIVAPWYASITVKDWPILSHDTKHRPSVSFAEVPDWGLVTVRVVTIWSGERSEGGEAALEEGDTAIAWLAKSVQYDAALAAETSLAVFIESLRGSLPDA